MEKVYHVDKVIVINLDHRPDRLEKTLCELKRVGFSDDSIERFSAVNGKKLNLDELPVTTRVYHDLKHNRDNHLSIATMGTIGCYLSHLGVWKKMIAENIDSVLVCEDDLNFVDDFKVRSEELMRKMVQKHWIDTGMLYLHSTTNIPNKDAFEDTEETGIRKCRDVFGSMACYRITLDAARRLAKVAEPIEMQVDAFVSIYASNPANHVPLYVAKPDLVKIAVLDLLTGDIQSTCVKCYLPSSTEFYGSTLVVLLLMFILLIYLTWKAWRCRGT